MLHIKFRGNRPAGSGEDFLRVFTTYGRGGHLGHVTSIMSSVSRKSTVFTFSYRKAQVTKFDLAVK